MNGLAIRRSLTVPLNQDGVTLPVISQSGLLALPADRLHSLDTRSSTCLCAEGLPGAEGFNLRAVLASLDKWTDAIRRYTHDSAGYYHRAPQGAAHAP